MGTFSERQGFVQPPKIRFRDDLPNDLRFPLVEIIRGYIPAIFLAERAKAVLDPYGVGRLPLFRDGIAVERGEDDALAFFKRVVLGCEWFQVYDIVEDLFEHLRFHEQELASPDEEPRFAAMQDAINCYFVYAGIGWQVVNGKVLTRGDEVFEASVRAASGELATSRPTAEGRLRTAIESLSKRPQPDTAGAVSDAIAAVECVLSDVAGIKAGEKASLSDFLKRDEFFPGSLKAGMSGLWGYACNEGARHGKEGVEPDFEQARFVVSICAAFAALLNSVYRKG